MESNILKKNLQYSLLIKVVVSIINKGDCVY